MLIRREWAMPSGNTFECKPIMNFVQKYLNYSKVSIDPFSRNSDLATYTNDLNHYTSAQSHMLALDWLWDLYEKDISPDLIIFDPPYSHHQIRTTYDKVGLDYLSIDSNKALRWNQEKDVINKICSIGTTFLNFGWNTYGMGVKRGFEICEILIVCHGPGHHDTLCMAEKKISI